MNLGSSQHTRVQHGQRFGIKCCCKVITTEVFSDPLNVAIVLPVLMCRVCRSI